MGEAPANQLEDSGSLYRITVTGKTHRNRHIDPHLPSLNVLLKMRCRAARAGEDSDAVTVLVRINEVDGGIEAGGFEGYEDGAEDFLSVAFHVGLDVGDESRADLMEEERG